MQLLTNSLKRPLREYSLDLSLQLFSHIRSLRAFDLTGRRAGHLSDRVSLSVLSASPPLKKDRVSTGVCLFLMAKLPLKKQQSSS